MIRVDDLCLSFGTQKIFDNVQFIIQEHQRVGLVGRNGTGKTTLLAMIANQLPGDSGFISLAKNKKIAYLPQHIVINSEKSIFDETLTVFNTVYPLYKEAQELQAFLEKNLILNEHSVNRYSELCHELSYLNAESLYAETKKVLIGLGFNPLDLHQPVESLSGGWRMRIVLAKLLLQKADFYLFDEPTNHLDITAKDWFLQFLQESDFGFMLVCHERYFLDKVCTSIVELECGNGKIYSGNYSDYEKQKKQNLAVLEASYEQQQRELKQKQAVIDRFKAKATKASMAQSMIKALDKIERIILPPTPKKINFSFPPIIKPGRVVLSVQNIAHSFDAKKIFEHVSFEVERGEKIALIAPNGVGKTTLFNLILQKYPLQKGFIEFGSQVIKALFEQDQHAWIQEEKTVLENIEYAHSGASMQTIRSSLGAFLFSHDDVHKKVKYLSGGEKSRLGMVRLLLHKANLLFLDEPTNHLDIISKEILLSVLKQYQGTIFFVSHDHDFINNLATRIIKLSSTGATSYHGNYHDYLYSTTLNTQQNQENNVKPELSKEKFQKNADSLRKKSEALEKKIEKIEQELATVENSFVDLLYGTKEFDQAQKKLIDLQHQLKVSMEQWEELAVKQ